jgi:hypothetical protein
MLLTISVELKKRDKGITAASPLSLEAESLLLASKSGCVLTAFSNCYYVKPWRLAAWRRGAEANILGVAPDRTIIPGFNAFVP